MGRAGGRAGEGVSPLHSANGFNGLQQNPLAANGAALVKQASFGNSLAASQQNSALPQNAVFDAAGPNISNMNDLSSLLPQLSGPNSVNELLMQYRKAAQDQQQKNGMQNAPQSAFSNQQAASAAQLQAQLLGVARNGQFAEQLSQMMSTNQVMMMQNNFEGSTNGQAAAAHRLNGTTPHPLQVTFDLHNQTQSILPSGALGSPVSRPVASYAADSLSHQAAQAALSPHSGGPSMQGPAQPRSNGAFSFVKNGDVATNGQAPGDAGESSGAESAEDAPPGKGDRKEARKEYHKRIERKRRDRMRNLYDELRSLVNPDEPADKNSVLAGAVSLIQELRDENIKLLSRVHIKEKRAKMLNDRKGSGDNVQIKVLKSKDSVDGGKKPLSDDGARAELQEGGTGKKDGKAMDEEEPAQSSSSADKQQERTSGEETSEGSEQGASKTSDSVTEGSEEGARKRPRVGETRSMPA